MPTTRSLRGALPTTAILALLTGSLAAAQGVKIGYVDRDSLIRQMPEYETAGKEINLEGQRLRGELDQRVQAFQAEVDLFGKQRTSLSEDAVKERGAQLAAQQQAIETAQAEAEQALALKERQLLAPLFKRAQEAIETVAKSQSVSVVLRPEALVYVDPALTIDLTADVKTALGLTGEKVG